MNTPASSPPPLPSSPDERIWIIERSLECLRLGCWSLVPPFGLLISFIALMRFYTVQQATRGCWNPARPQLVVGACLALVGMWFSAAAFAGLLKIYDSELALFVLVSAGVSILTVGAIILSLAEGLGSKFKKISGKTLLALVVSMCLLIEITLLVAAESPEFRLIPVLLFTGSLFMWSFGSLGGGSMNESFREFPREMLVWFILASYFAIQGMVAMASLNESTFVLIISSLIPLALFARIIGAVFSAKVRASVLASVGLHVTWTVLSVPFLGAAAFELGLWDKVHVGGVSLFDFWRALW